jgi:hypothetical protein
MSVRYEIIDCEQGSPEWFEARRGIPTASRFAAVMAQGKGGEDSKTRYKYMKQLAAEIHTGEPIKTYSNDRMELGKQHEPELRSQYLYERDDIDIVKVGFMKMNRLLCATGCSPDGLIGEDGLVEFKSAEPHLLIDILSSGHAPPTAMAQIQGQLWISGRQWCDLVIGWPKMPLSITRIRASDTYIAPLAMAVKAFNNELADMVAWLKRL